ncbi:MAG: stage 0 sporulation protein [Lentisphaerales bacterium]|jgi:cell fate regulator YaaT (PSP1 superfamily)|nr:MAG: stage 0 sporulation protein [Lentisphaerales bacterium]
MSREVRVELDDGSVLRCGCSPDLAIHVGDQCVVSAYNVLEFGRVVRMTNSPGPESDEESVSKVLRRATLQDQAKARENALYQKMSADTCVKKLETSGTDVQIISVRHSFDRKVVTIVYTADERIQSRDIINELSTELGARIEMKQIGVRDAAGLLGGVGPCGRTLCCNSWLKQFDTVSVRMAKNQRLSLSPNTISGVCGRLKCCLRYENACYTELARKMPRDGAIVGCPEGKGCVIDKNVLGQKVKLRMDDSRVREYDVGDLTM